MTLFWISWFLKYNPKRHRFKSSSPTEAINQAGSLTIKKKIQRSYKRRKGGKRREEDSPRIVKCTSESLKQKDRVCAFIAFSVLLESPCASTQAKRQR